MKARADEIYGAFEDGLDAETLATAARDDEPKTSLRRSKPARSVVREILKHKDDPAIEMRLGGEVLATLEPGSIAMLIGGTGRGKTTLAANILVEHAREFGPGLGVSFELPARQWVARTIGTRCDESWSGVLHGRVDEQRMLEVLPERLEILDREDASLAEFRKAVAGLKADYPGQPLLAVIDYVQLANAEATDDIRPRIGRTMREIDAITRDEWIVSLVLSQGSRISARALSGGEKLGAETTDTGAESAALEQWASVTIAIGKLGERGEDGSQPVDISIGKSRMDERGDTVRGARVWGRSGLWRLTGDAKPAAEVRAEKTVTANTTKVTAARLAMVKHAEMSAESLTRAQLIAVAAKGKEIGQAALTAALGDGELVEVAVRKKRAPTWQIWTPARAESAGVQVVSRVAS